MALIAQTFAERYAELVAWEPTLTDLLLDVQRREVCGRKAVEEKCDAAFQDVLHVAAVMIADRKAREKGSLAHLSRFEVALHKKETAVWFQAAPPRQVSFPVGRPLRAFPHAAFASLCQEERELRQWHYGVERRLREHIEEACGRAWFFLNCMRDSIASENLSRQRLEREEDEAFTAVKQRFFRAVPADYYRHLVVARYGHTAAPVAPVEGLTLEEVEEEARAALEAEEVAGRGAAFKYLQDVSDLHFFTLNHNEVVGRYQIEEEECNALFPVILQACREDFGIVFYHVPSLALHMSSSLPCMRALCLAQLQEAPRRTAATKARFSWTPAPPARLVAGPRVPEEDSVTELHVEGDRGAEIDYAEMEEEEEAEEEETAEITGVATDACDYSRGAPPPPLEGTLAAAATSALGFERELGSSDFPEPTEKHREWEVATSPMALVAVTLRAYEESAPVTVVEATSPTADDAPLHTLYAYDVEEVRLPVLYAELEEAPQPPVLYAYDEAKPVPVSAVVESPSHNGSELTINTAPLRRALFSRLEIFTGDPFADAPAKGSKSKKSKKSKKQK
ncbi:hypothetical protein NESM_000026400 [Novymonas esmeraldas]|uniref:Uncharacterized protein n=1 Tax=Novymonas esmeraldas TaxID=1808958 RepID=A0AAW0EZH4_9TRYP